MIYLDSCIPMYLVGAAHPLKTRVIELIPLLLSSKEEFVTTAEAFQEIIHRYVALKDKKHLSAAYEALEEMVSLVAEVSKEDTDVALSLCSQYEGLSSRDCLHVAVMRRIACQRIWTYDTHFDIVPSIQRIQ